MSTQYKYVELVENTGWKLLGIIPENSNTSAKESTSTKESISQHPTLIQSTPIQSTPIQSAPIQSTPIQSTLIQFTPPRSISPEPISQITQSEPIIHDERAVPSPSRNTRFEYKLRDFSVIPEKNSVLTGFSSHM